MKSRTHERKKKTRQQTPDTTAQAKPMFQSRPFEVQSQSAQKSQQPDLKRSLKQAERYGHSLSRMATEGRKGEREQPAGNQGRPVQLARKRAQSDTESEKRKREEKREKDRPQMTANEFKGEFARQSEEQADEKIAGRREGRDDQGLGFHVTKGKNVESITTKEGLDPKYGGKGGASEKRSEMEYEERSRGKMHVSTNTYLSGNYANEMKDENPNVLGVRMPRKKEKDPDDPRGSYTTSESIPPQNIANLGEGVAKKAMENKNEADQRFLNAKNENTSNKRAANKTPNTRIEEKRQKLKEANKRDRELHAKGKRILAPEPWEEK